MSSSDILMKYLRRPPKPYNSIIENGDKEDYFEGLAIEKPENLSPTEMELRIQADRVMFSLRKAISVLNVMAHLPFLLENNAKLIEDNFTEKEFNFILYAIKLYDETSVIEEDFIQSCEEIYDMVNKTRVALTKSRSFEGSIVDSNLSQVIHMIFTNKCIREAIKNADNPSTIPYIEEFIRNLEELQKVAEIKLYVTGTEEEARDKQLRQAFKSNVMLSAAIKDLEQQLENQREQLGKELNEKVTTFEKYNNKIAAIKEEFQISIEKSIHESEKKMMHQCLESEEKQAVLAIEAEEITKQYQVLLDDHLEEEKKLRAKRAKTETQLQNWLTKYDQDIGEKQAEYETLKKEYDDEKEALDDLEEKMDEQEKEYNTLMAAKEEEEERLYMEMAFQFLMNRSARIIQRAWKAYRERRARRKGKKGKKGKDGKKSQGKK